MPIIRCAYDGALTLPNMGPDITVITPDNATIEAARILIFDLTSAALARIREIHNYDERDLLSSHWPRNIVVLAPPGDAEKVVDAFCVGAIGYVWQDQLNTLADTLRLAQKTTMNVDPLVAIAMLARIKRLKPAHITSVECAVVATIALGEESDIASQYVVRHLANVAIKLCHASSPTPA